MLAWVLNVDFAGSGAGDVVSAARHTALLLVGAGVVRLLAVL